MSLSSAQRGAMYGKGGKWAAEGPIKPFNMMTTKPSKSFTGGSGAKGVKVTYPIAPKGKGTRGF